MLTYKVRSTLEKPLKPLNPYIINTKLIVIQFMLTRQSTLEKLLNPYIIYTKLIVIRFMLTRHIQFMSNILLFLCCLLKSYLCIQFNFSLCLVGLSFWKIQFLKYDQENIKADNSNQLRNDAGRSDVQGKYLMQLLLALISTKFQFGLNICLIFGLIIHFFHVGFNIYQRQKTVGLNIFHA